MVEPQQAQINLWLSKLTAIFYRSISMKLAKEFAS
jgi:hypothetical protein